MSKKLFLSITLLLLSSASLPLLTKKTQEEYFKEAQDEAQKEIYLNYLRKLLSQAIEQENFDTIADLIKLEPTLKEDLKQGLREQLCIPTETAQLRSRPGKPFIMRKFFNSFFDAVEDVTEHASSNSNDYTASNHNEDNDSPISQSGTVMISIEEE